MRRTATCSCGGVRVTVEGDPQWVNMCHCLACQRRSGSPFQTAAFFEDEQIVETAGERRSYARPGDSGGAIETEFCPVCGVSMLFRVSRREGMVGVHVGCFADPAFPPPNRIWFRHRAHPWVVIPEGRDMGPD